MNVTEFDEGDERFINEDDDIENMNSSRKVNIGNLGMDERCSMVVPISSRKASSVMMEMKPVRCDYNEIEQKTFYVMSEDSPSSSIIQGDSS